MTDQALSVPFHGATLYIVDHEAEPFTPMKPIVEGMGVSWQGQHEKLQGNPARWGIKMILIPSDRGDQQTLCLPLRKLPGWLMTIHPNRVRPEIRERVIQYQNECDDVLWRYWSEHHKASAPLPEDSPFHLSGEARSFAIQYLDECQKAAQAGKAPPPLDEARVQHFADGLMTYMLMTKRWLVSFGWNEGISLTPVKSGAYVITPDEFAKVIGDPGTFFPAKFLPKIAEACIERLARAAAR